ncbi:hypothetical protein [Chryseobacterium binzhouense]|uniref:hypothetical protein n=1 Tax=Chryseobacterium binzhouense TaxID=2593646 RepID=UPI0028A0B4BF|nr:hypothetical protein [Chryseobacterium binzhouense]
MTTTIILYPEYIPKEKLLSIIYEFGKNANLEFNDLNPKAEDYEEDIQLYREVTDVRFHHILFDLRSEKEYNEYSEDVNSVYIINDKKYIPLIFIKHDRDIMDKVGDFVLLLAKYYPDIVMTEDSYTDFYTMERITKEGMPWVIAPEDWDIY